MLIYSMSVSVDGFIADREGAFGWTVPDEEQFRFHIVQVRELGGYLCGRRLYETMLPWETDPSMRDNELGAAFADVWCAIPKVVFSRTLDSVQGNAGPGIRRADRLRRACRVATARRMTGLPTGLGVRGRVGRAGSPPSAPTWSTPWEVTPSTPDHASTSGPTMCPTRSTLQITRRDCRPRWTISPLPLNAERRLPRSHGARRYGDHPCRSCRRRRRHCRSRKMRSNG